MRLTTQSLKKQLSVQSHHDSAKSANTKQPLLPKLVLAWLAGAAFVFALAPYDFWLVALLSPLVLYWLLLPTMSNWRAFGSVKCMVWDCGAWARFGCLPPSIPMAIPLPY